MIYFFTALTPHLVTPRCHSSVHCLGCKQYEWWDWYSEQWFDQDNWNSFGGNLDDFRSEPLINPLYYGFMSIETWSSLWNWIFSTLNKVFSWSSKRFRIFIFHISDSKKSLFPKSKCLDFKYFWSYFCSLINNVVFGFCIFDRKIIGEFL